jgi:3-keto-5-aminohexanoate cleavage enzyme
MTIDWEKVQEGVERERHRMIWRPYGLPATGHPERSIFFDGSVAPSWDVPKDIIISAAITGAFFTPNENPNQPITPDQIRTGADLAVVAGASTVHIHVRDDRGYNVLSKERFEAVILPLKEKWPDLAVDGCLVCALPGEWEEMIEILAARVLDCVPINPTATYIGDSLFAKPVPILLEKTRLILESGSKPIIAVYTDGDVSNADRYLFRSGLLETGAYWLILPALPGCSPMMNARQMFDGLLRTTRAIYDVDPDGVVAVCAAGRPSTYLATIAAALGLHIRVGMEDTIWRWPHREDLIGSNEEMVRAASEIASLLGRTVASPSRYREIIGLEKTALAPS